MVFLIEIIQQNKGVHVMKVTSIGIDLAKSVFQLHGSDQTGRKVFSKKLSRSQVLPFLANHPSVKIAMEACGSAHYWAREIKKLGHDTSLIAPQFVKPYVKSNKNDAADAEAICEALSRPKMRFVSPKSIEQQDIQSFHRIRSQRVKNRTALVNSIRGLLSEYGVILPQGIHRLRRELSAALESALKDEKISPSFMDAIVSQQDELRQLDERITEIDLKIKKIDQNSSDSKRLKEIPGVGVLTSTAILAVLGNPKSFKNGREFAAFLGLVPKQESSGGKAKLLGISKRGDVYLRSLLIHGARACIRFLEKQNDSHQKRWLTELIKRRGMNKAVVALANKNARRIWAVLAHQEDFKVFA
jgi:transposase